MIAPMFTPYIYDSVKLSTRERTSDGFLRGKAVATKVGILNYDASELGLGSRGQLVRVKQTPDSVFHPETMRSVQNATVTVGHPEGGVTPDNWRDVSVGSVGSPEKFGEEHVGVDILLGDQTAIATVEGGWDELSIGKRFNLAPSPNDPACDYQTVGPIDVNHVAVVQRGRAGPDVRVLDSEANRSEEDEFMNDTQFTQFLTAIQGQIPASVGDSAAVAKSVADAIAPLLKQVEDQSNRIDQDAAKAQAAKTRDDLKKLHTEAVDAADKAGYERGMVEGQMRADALSLIQDPNMRAQFAKTPLKQLLIAATQDWIPGAEAVDEHVLHGVVIAKKTAMDSGMGHLAAAFGTGGSGTMPISGYQPGGATPFGQSPFAPNAMATVADRRQANKDAYVEAVDAAYATGNIVNMKPKDKTA